jgi:hypothetical protein
VDWSLQVAQVMPTSRWITLDYMPQAIRLLYFAIPLWGISVTAIKTGISLMILRVRYSLPWKIFLFTLIGLQASYTIGNVFFLLLVYCKPLEAGWNLAYPRENCDRRASQIASNVHCNRYSLVTGSNRLCRKTATPIAGADDDMFSHGTGNAGQYCLDRKERASQHFWSKLDGRSLGECRLPLNLDHR